MKFIELDPATWLHKEGTEVSTLLRKRDGKMCCMGVMCKAYGLADTIIEPHGALACEVRDHLPEDVRDWVYRAAGDEGVDNGLSRMYHVNDWGQLADAPDVDDEFANHAEAKMKAFFDETTDAQVVEVLNIHLALTDAPFRFVLKAVQP